jgi:outer membrane protein assembly factor BamB
MGVGDMVNRAEALKALAVKKLKEEGKSDAEITEQTKHLRPIGEVWCLDLKMETDDPSKRVKWKYPVGRTVLGGVAVCDDSVYFGSRDGFFYRVSTDGELKARFNARRAIITSPAVGGGNVYFVTESGRLYGLNAETLEPVWNVSLGQGALFMSSPALGNGHVYVGTDGSGIVCAGEPSDVVRESIWGGQYGGPGHPGYGGGGSLPTAGRYSWMFPEKKDDVPAPRIEAPACCLDGSLYVGITTPERHGLARIDIAKQGSGQAGSARPQEAWFYPTRRPVVRSAAASSFGEVFVVDGRKGEAGRHLHCLRLESGKPVWKRPVAANAEGAVLLTERALYVNDQPDRLTCLARDEAGTKQETKWSVTIGGSPWAPLAWGDILLVAVVSDPSVRALDEQSGIEVWRASTTSKPSTPPIVFTHDPAGAKTAEADSPDAGDVLPEYTAVAGCEAGLVGIDVLTGDVKWKLPCGHVRSVVACTSTLAVCITQKGDVRFVNVPRAKLLRARARGADPRWRPVLAGETLLYCTPTAIKKVGVSLKVRPLNWLKTTWMGSLTAPPVGADSHVFFATDKRGLICAAASRR